MLLTIEADSPDISHLLHKHPAKVHSLDANFGVSHVFYPKPNKVALLVEIDAFKLTRRGNNGGFALQPYVNDRSYAINSYLTVALNQQFRTALGHRCNKRPELTDQVFQLRVHLPCLPSRGGEQLLRKLFEPLGYQLEVEGIPLDTKFPEWGPSRYFNVTLETSSVLSRVLRHLYILIPVLDNEKHYWVGPEEVQKLLERTRDWLGDHPEQELIVNRYLKFQKYLTRPALEALSEAEDESVDPAQAGVAEEATEKKIGLHDQRLNRVCEVLTQTGAATIADLGCGEGKLLRRLLKASKTSQIIGMDVCTQSLERTESSLERLPEKVRSRVKLMQGSLLYNDERLHEVDAAALVEVIEHIEPDRLDRVATNLFSRMKPPTVVITTPNSEYNQVWESLPAGKFRHNDHRFEWTRAEFEQWVNEVKGDYEVEISGLGDAHAEYGCPSQMAVFRR